MHSTLSHSQPVAVPPVKKKRGGYRPGSGRKRIHPIKAPKAQTPVDIPESPTAVSLSQDAAKIVPMIIPPIIQATTLPSIRSLTSNIPPSLPPISALTNMHQHTLSISNANKFVFQPTSQSVKNVALLIQIEHQKMVKSRVRHEELSVQDFEVELLLGLERESLSSSPCSSDTETVPSRQTRNNTSYEHLFDSFSGSEDELSPDSQDEDFYSRKRRASDLDAGRSKKSARVFTTTEERDFLESLYQVDANPSMSQMEQFAEKLGWPLKRMKQWFSNKRSYGKRKMLYNGTGSL